MATDWRERLGGPTALAFGGLACARAWLSLLYVSPGAEASFHGCFDVGYVGVGVAVVLAARRIGGFSRWRWPYVTALLSMLAATLCSGVGSVWAVPAPVRAVMACVSGTGLGSCAFSTPSPWCACGFCASCCIWRRTVRWRRCSMGQSTGVPIAPLIGGLSVTQLAIMVGDLLRGRCPRRCRRYRRSWRSL